VPDTSFLYLSALGLDITYYIITDTFEYKFFITQRVIVTFVASVNVSVHWI